MGVTTVRPASSSTFVSAFTVTGAASVHAALNDNSDASYVSTGPSEAFEGALITLGDTGTLAAGAVRRESDSGFVVWAWAPVRLWVLGSSMLGGDVD